MNYSKELYKTYLSFFRELDYAILQRPYYRNYLAEVLDLHIEGVKSHLMYLRKKSSFQLVEAVLETLYDKKEDNYCNGHWIYKHLDHFNNSHLASLAERQFLKKIEVDDIPF